MNIGRHKISYEGYHADTEWYSKSGLDLVNRSMAHWFARDSRKTTAALDFGAAFHCAVLTPDIFKTEYIVAPDIDRRTKAGKEAWSELQECGKKILSAPDNETVVAIQSAVFSHPTARQLLTQGDAEESFFWVDKTTGVQSKCRPDYLRRDNIVIDIKTTEDASYPAFRRSVYKYRYHVQGAFYMDGVSAVTGAKHDDFVLLAVEKTPPYGVAIYRLFDDLINEGRVAYEQNLRDIAAYQLVGDGAWAGYPAEIQDML